MVVRVQTLNRYKPHICPKIHEQGFESRIKIALQKPKDSPSQETESIWTAELEAFPRDKTSDIFVGSGKMFYKDDGNLIDEGSAPITIVDTTDVMVGGIENLYEVVKITYGPKDDVTFNAHELDAIGKKFVQFPGEKNSPLSSGNYPETPEHFAWFKAQALKLLQNLQSTCREQLEDEECYDFLHALNWLSSEIEPGAFAAMQEQCQSLAMGNMNNEDDDSVEEVPDSGDDNDEVNESQVLDVRGLFVRQNTTAAPFTRQDTMNPNGGRPRDPLPRQKTIRPQTNTMDSNGGSDDSENVPIAEQSSRRRKIGRSQGHSAPNLHQTNKKDSNGGGHDSNNEPIRRRQVHWASIPDQTDENDSNGGGHGSYESQIP